MVTLTCDICKKTVDRIETIILYSERIDFCKECKKKATEKKKRMREIIKFYNKKMCKDITFKSLAIENILVNTDKEIREAEQNLLKKRL